MSIAEYVPPEIWTIVFEKLSEADNIVSMINLHRTCKHLYRVLKRNKHLIKFKSLVAWKLFNRNDPTQIDSFISVVGDVISESIKICDMIPMIYIKFNDIINCNILINDHLLNFISKECMYDIDPYYAFTIYMSLFGWKSYKNHFTEIDHKQYDYDELIDREVQILNEDLLVIIKKILQFKGKTYNWNKLDWFLFIETNRKINTYCSMTRVTRLIYALICILISDKNKHS